MRATVTLMRLTAVVLLFWSTCLAQAEAQARSGSNPDIILVTIDTIRADHVGCYGKSNIKTPAMDALARDGVRFANSFTASPITNSSHATILTGLYPSSHGVTDFGVPLGESHSTLASLLKARGYRTAAFIGAVILDSRQLAPGLDRGFDHYDNFPQKPTTSSRFGRLERRARDVVGRAKKWMAANTSAPRFVWIHLFDPHDPYEPPPPFSATYKERPYNGEIAYADHALSELLSSLRRQRRYDKSLIVLVGDHGEGLGEHNEQTHGIFLYDSTLHVPLIAKLPDGRRAGTVVNAQVRTTDITPTILDFTQTTRAPNSRPPKFDGRSLKALILSGSGADEPAIAETDYPLRFGWAPLRSLRTSAFKFIEAPRPELYDLSTDPAENKNMYEPWNERVKDSRSALARFASSAKGRTDGSGVPKTTVDELRALGYLGPEGATDVPDHSLLPDPKDKIEIQNLLHAAMMATEDGRTNAARSLLVRATQIDPTSAIAFSQLGRLELKIGNYAQAAAHLGIAHKLRPEDSATALYLGEANEKAGNLPAARDAYEASLKLAPGQAGVREALGRIYLGLHRPKQAVEQLEAAVFLQPKNVGTRVEFGRALIADGQVEKAVSELEQATRMQPRNRQAFLLMQTAYERLGRNDLAKRAAARASSLAR
ncbi:MAG TPA: sulfatase-like hydrolase/transferase [Terriglobales bacterium]|nr:sulfatase-like hydrolase/transferase [Terriglobales bacterium]